MKLRWTCPYKRSSQIIEMFDSAFDRIMLYAFSVSAMILTDVRLIREEKKYRSRGITLRRRNFAPNIHSLMIINNIFV